MSIGVVMYGPPAAGKDTVTAALCQRDHRFRQFRRLKLGKGRTSGYRMASPEDIVRLRNPHEVIWENQRYGATYYVDRTFLTQELAEAWPVLHVGQEPAIFAVQTAFPATRWLTVYLWCPREVAEQRVAARQTGDTAERMAIWDTTEPISDALFIDTSISSPAEAAALVDLAARRMLPPALRA